MIVVSSCHKGDEPMPCSEHNNSSSNYSNSTNLKSGDPASPNSGDGGGTIVGGDDNEDDNDGDNVIGGDGLGVTPVGGSSTIGGGH